MTELEKEKIINGFPSDFIDPQEKNGKKYCLAWCNAVDSTGETGINPFYGGNPDQNRYTMWRAYARGNQPIAKYKPILGVSNKKTKKNGEDYSYKVLSWEILDVASKYVNVLIGKIIKNDNSIGINAIDKRAQDERRLKKAQLQSAVLNQQYLDSISTSAGIPFESGVFEDGVMPPPQNLGEIDVYQEMFYKEDYCLAVQDMLRQINEEDNYPDILVECARDLIEIAIAVTKTYRVGNKIRRRRCIPERCVSSSTSKSNFEDIKYFGEYWDLTIGQLKELAGSQFTEDEYRKIAEDATGSKFNEFNLQEYYDEYMCYPWDRTKVTILDLVWFSPDWETYQVVKSKYGNVAPIRKEFKWWQSLDAKGVSVDKFNETNENKVIRFPLDNQYQAMWIKGTKFIFNYGKSKNMLKNESNLGRTISPYTIYKIKKCPIETAIPVFDNIQINWLQYQHHAAKSRPSGLDIEFSALQDMSLEGAGGTKMTPKQILQIYFDTGILLWRRKDGHGNLANWRPINELQNGLNPAAAQHLQNVLTNINLLRDQLGLNELTDASTPNSDMGVGVAKIAASATDDALRGLQFAFDQINLLTHEKTVMHISGMAASGLAPYYVDALGMNSMATISLMSDLTHHQLGCYLMKQPSMEMRARIFGYCQEAVKAGTLMDYEAMEIELEPNIWRSIKLLKTYRAQKDRKAQQQQTQMYKQEEEKNIRSAQATAQFNTDSELQIAQSKSDLAWDTAQAEVFKDTKISANKAFLLQVEYKLKQGVALSLEEERRLTTLMNTAAQGRINLQIASMKPKPTTSSARK